MTFVQPLAVFADVMTFSNAFEVNSDPYGLATMDLTDEDYGISVASSLASVKNTVDYSYCNLWCQFVDSSGALSFLSYPLDSSGHVSCTVPSGKSLTHYGLEMLKSAIPVPGVYSLEFDFASDFSVDYSALWVASFKYVDNASRRDFGYDVAFDSVSGDVYYSDIVQLGNVDLIQFKIRLSEPLASGTTFGGDFKINFTVTNSSANNTIGDSSNLTSEYQNDVSSSLSDISSSIGDMSESLDSAAESLEYISTSQNLIIQGIDNVIMHISDQLYAFWDQLYNLIHEPTYAKLEQILAALKAIANNSDISAVVDTIEETTEEQIANDNANTAKVEEAVEKHGNFIIEGLKSLFIPSDDYFSSLFGDLNGFFKDRFGFLYTPIDLLVRFIDLIYGSSAEFTGIPFPELKWDGHVLLEAQTVSFDILEVEEFKNIQNILYFLTNLVMIGALIALIHKKFEEVMRN